MSVIDKIEVIMKEKGWTKYKLAKESRLPQSTITSLLGGKVKNPSTESLTKIANALGVSASFLLGEIEPELAEYYEEDMKLDAKILSALKILTDEEGFILEELREDMFNAINSNLYMTHAYHNASDNDYFIRRFSDYFDSPEEYTDSEHDEAIEEYNKAYDIRTIKSVLYYHDYDRKMKFLSDLQTLIEKHNIKTPSEEKEFDIPIEELVNHTLTYKGHVLTEEQKKQFVKLLQAAAEMLEK